MSSRSLYQRGEIPREEDPDERGDQCAHQNPCRQPSYRGTSAKYLFSTVTDMSMLFFLGEELPVCLLMQQNEVAFIWPAWVHPEWYISVQGPSYGIIPDPSKKLGQFKPDWSNLWKEVYIGEGRFKRFLRKCLCTLHYIKKDFDPKPVRYF